MKRFQRFQTALAGFLAMGMILAGCSASPAASSEGSAAGSSLEASAQTASSSAEKASIIVWTNLEDETDTLQNFAEKWSQETGNTAEVIHQTPDLQKFAQAAQSADGPDAVFGIANDQLASYVSAGLVQEVPDEVYNDADYSDAAVKGCYVNGKKYAVPIAVETITLFYNTDKIKSAPKTWDEMIDEAKANGGIQFEATSIYYDLGFLRAFNGYVFNYTDDKYDAADIGLGNENAAKAYAYIQDLAVKDNFFASDITSDLAKSNFQNGQTAFYIGGPWDIDGFTSANTPFAVTTMPTFNGQNFVTPVDTQVGFVSADSKNQAAVWDFYEYLLENAPQELYKAGGRIPASLKEQDAMNADDATQAFITQISYGEPLPGIAEMGQVWTPYSDNMKLLLENSITPEKAAANIQQQVQEGIDLMNSGK